MAIGGPRDIGPGARPSPAPAVGRLGPARTALYVPGDRPEMLNRVLERGADIVIVDLEDAVAPARKGPARAAVAAWLDGLGSAAALASRTRVQVQVRINPGRLAGGDIAAVVAPALTGLTVAKAEPSTMTAIDEAVAEAEAAAGLEVGSIRLYPLIETAAAVLAMDRIASDARVARLAVGEVDLASELGVQLGPDETELAWVRSQLVLHSAAAGLEAPIGPVWTDISDLEGLRRSSERLRRLGYAGRSCIHPSQVPVVREVFTPGPDEVAEARRLVERFEAAVAAGEGVLTDDRGRMVDEAVVRAARRTLAAAEE